MPPEGASKRQASLRKIYSRLAAAVALLTFDRRAAGRAPEEAYHGKDNVVRCALLERASVMWRSQTCLARVSHARGAQRSSRVLPLPNSTLVTFFIGNKACETAYLAEVLSGAWSSSSGALRVARIDAKASVVGT